MKSCDYVEQKLTCPNGENWIMESLIRPASRENGAIVLMVHDSVNKKEDQDGVYMRLAEKLAQQGIASVRFNFSETGKNIENTESSGILQKVSDIEAALQYVKTLDFVDETRIGAFGMGMGGTVLSLTADRYPEEIQAVCLWGPSTCEPFIACTDEIPSSLSWKTFCESGGTLHGEKLNIGEQVSRYKKPVLLIGSDGDKVTNQTDPYIKYFPGGKIKLLKTESGNFSETAEQEACKLITEFFAKQIQYPHLFQPLKIGTMTVRNRVIAAPITKYGYLPSPADELELIASKARGGAGIVILGSCAVDEEKSLIYYESSSLDGAKRPLYNEEISIIHQYGAKASVQLLHCGMWADMRGKDTDPVGPYTFERKGKYQGLEGVEKNQIMDGKTVTGLDESQMEEICAQYAHAAATAKQMGFDMVMLHFAHGWLPAEFLSPFFNKRTDQYGGCFENRIRFPMKIVESVRNAVGKDFPIDMRIGACEYVKGGIEVEDVIRFVKRIEDKIDMIHVSSGLDKFVTQTTFIESPSVYPHGINLSFAEKMKREVRIPVVTVGGITMPEEAEQILAEGKADAIALGRALIADPGWVNKAGKGETGTIRPCLRCCSCYGVATDNIGQGCAVNPESGRALRLQTERQLFRNKAEKNVVVIGGGPAGMQAALSAVEMGHRVTLLEKSSRLGGLLNISNHDSVKIDMNNFKNYLIYQVTHSAIDLRLNCEANPEMVKRFHPDEVIVAVGSTPAKPPIPGIDGRHVIDVVTAHEEEERLGEKIVIIGAGPSGCELALSLAGKGKKVIIIEQTDKIAAAGNLLYRAAIQDLFDHSENISCKLNSTCCKIADGFVLIADDKGRQEEISCDSVVYSVGMKACSSEAETYRALDYDVRMIGDCVRPRRINEAIHEGYFAGSMFQFS